MKVLVTGCGGNIGAGLARYFQGAGISVTAHFRHPPNGAELARAGHPAGISTGELTTPGDLFAKPFDLVVHAAARSPGPGVKTRDYVADNVVACRHLFDAAAASNCNAIVLLSGISVYGRVSVDEIDEKTSCVDTDDYGLSKRLCERLLEDTQDHIAGVVLRLPGVLGPGAKTPWLAKTLATMRAGEAVHAANPDAPFNNAVHVDDLASFILSLAPRLRKRFDTLCIAAADPMSVRAVLHTLKSHSASDSPILFDGPSTHPFTVSSAKAQREYAYRPAAMADLLSRFARQP